MRGGVIGCLAAMLWLAGCSNSPNGMNAGSGLPVQGPAGSGATAPVDTNTAPGNNNAATNTQTDPAASSNMQPANTQNTQPANTQNTQPASTQNMQPANMQPTQTTQPMMQGPQGLPPPDGFHANAMNECGLHTKWPGDEYCILPPPADKGFQLHIGPSNYDNPEAEYLLQPGEENVRTYSNTSANDKMIYFYVRQYRMRPGAHHTIVRDMSTGRRLSGSDVNQDHPVGGITAPENAGIGIPLVAHAPISTDHHAINTTQKTLLQEVWVNFWYVDPSKVTEATNLLYDPGSVTDTVAPHQDVDLGPWDCDIQGKGRLISMFGHVHANDTRFSAWRIRGGKKELFYESYHWEDPLWLEFTSIAKNPAPDPANKVSGGWTGILDLEQGDVLEWSCHENNTQDTTLTFVNQTYAGWMCIVIGDLVGTTCKSRNAAIPFNPFNE